MAGASEQTLSAQVPEDPFAVQVHDLAPEEARFPKKKKLQFLNTTAQCLSCII